MRTARGSFERLRLRTTNAAAAALYQRLGFRPLAATRTVRISSRSRTALERHEDRAGDPAAADDRPGRVDPVLYRAARLTLEFRYSDFYAGIRAGGQVVHLKLVDTTDPSIDFVERATLPPLSRDRRRDGRAQRLQADGVRLLKACTTPPGERASSPSTMTRGIPCTSASAGPRMTSAGGALASPSFRLGRWVSWLGLPVAAALIVASSSPWIAQLLRDSSSRRLRAWAPPGSITFVAALCAWRVGTARERGSNLRRLAVPSWP